jgi:hypothetical protein
VFTSTSWISVKLSVMVRSFKDFDYGQVDSLGKFDDLVDQDADQDEGKDDSRGNDEAGHDDEDEWIGCCGERHEDLKMVLSNNTRLFTKCQVVK